MLKIRIIKKTLEIATQSDNIQSEVDPRAGWQVPLMVI